MISRVETGGIFRTLKGSLLISAATWSLAAAAQAQTASPEVVTSLDAVSVTATRTEKPAIETPAAVSLIDREDIERHQAQTLQDILRDVPSVDFSGGPRTTVMSPQIRGLGDERVVIRLDNARQNYYVGHKARVFVEPDLLKQVEVLRGPGSTLFGSGAIGGVIDMKTVDAADLLKPGQSVGGRIKAGFASNRVERHLNTAAYARPNEWLDVLADVGGRSAENIETGSGDDIQYSGDDILTGLLKLSLTPAPHHRVTLQAQRFSDNHVIALTPDSQNAVTPANRVDRDTLQDTYNVTYSYADPANPWFDFKATAYQNQSRIREYRHSDRREDVRDQDTTGLDVANTTRIDAGSHRHAITYGTEIYKDEQIGYRAGAVTAGWYPDAEMNIAGGFVQDEITVGDWTLTPGVRFDSYDLSAQGQRSRSDNAVSPRISLAWQAASWLQPFVGYAEAFRAPTLSTMFNAGTHYPGNTFVANPDLEAERARNIEAGANLKFDAVLSPHDKLRTKVVAFQNKIDDFIEQTVGATTTTTSNIPQTRLRGLELEVVYDSLSWFGGVGASLVRGKNLTDDTPINSMPADKVALSGGYRVPEWGLEGGGRVSLVNGQHRVVSGSGVATGGYALFDLFLSWTPEALGRDVSFNLGVDNLLDKNYRAHNQSLYEAGRDVRATVTARF